MVEEPVVPVMISQLVSKFKELVKKVTYDKSEIDSKLNGKASNTLVSSSANGLMSSVDKIKLDGIDEEANKTVVDSAMSDSSVNPVQNKIVHQELWNKSDVGHVHSMGNITGLESELDSLNTTKANTNHTHTILVKSPDIPANADLNTYKTVGFYLCGNDNRGTAVNIPSSLVAGGFRLEVLSSANGVTQIIRTYYNTAEQVKLYFRHYYNSGSVWTEWQKVITTAIVDSSLSSTSTNPVQNKVVKSQLDSLNNNKANVNHTHTQLAGNVSYRQVTDKYENLRFNVSIKNGFCFITWNNPYQNLIDTGISLPEGTYFELGTVGVPEISEGSVTFIVDGYRVRVTSNGVLQGFIDTGRDGWAYGSLVYPTSSSSLPY